jgi:hypothetical protein
MNLQEQIKRMQHLMGIITESSYEEAWELIGQENKVIKDLVSSKGYEYDEESAQKLVPIIDKLPTTEVSYEQIKNFKNLENKEGDIGLIEKMYEISQNEDPRQGYKDYMLKRDESEKRNRGYDPVTNYDNIISGTYENPLVLYVDDTFYVIGGRTRLYASIAANTPIKVKIIKPSDF